MADAASSDLNKPLGARRPAAPRSPWPRRAAWAAAALPFLALAGFAGFVTLVKDPDGGRPVAVAAVEQAQRRTAEAAPAASAPAQTALAAPRQQANAAEVEEESGVRVMRPGSEAPNAVVIRVPDANVIRLAPAPDRRLVERGRHGPLPRIGEDGSKPFQVYARPAPQGGPERPRVAVLLGGLGISASATADAIARLPGEISLAFAPYGSDLERQAQRARADGHEIFLQAPMEPFDYPDNDPGPHTLTTSASAEENIDRLRWIMARIPGYVGVVNFMGARFASQESAVGPVTRELAQRGLMVVDDGSSGRSLLQPAAAALRTPALRADLVADLSQRPEAIDRELARLEQIARERGVAVASASALPLTIERLQRWSRTLEQRGLRLIPVSSAAQARGQITGAIR